MKIATLSALALVAAASAQVGPVDPSKLANGWCMGVTAGCEEDVVPVACGANATFAASCEAVFSTDKICMSFKTSCTCSAKDKETKDLSFEAFNATFSGPMASYGMCNNLQWSKNSTGPGIISGDYKPDGKRPNGTAATPKPSTDAAATTTSGAGAKPTGDKSTSAAVSVQAALSTMSLAAISLGMAMI